MYIIYNIYITATHYLSYLTHAYVSRIDFYRYASPDPSAPLKLADFGLAQMIKPHELMHSACGTPGYVAPEVLRNEGTGYGKEVDLWGIGVILYVLLCGFPPFYDENNNKLFQMIQSGEYEYPSPYWDAVSPEAINLIDKLLVLDPAQRLTAKQALKHTWLCDDIAAKELPHFNQNMRAFNARRRMKGAMRAVLMTHISRPFAAQHAPPAASVSAGNTDTSVGANATAAPTESSARAHQEPEIVVEPSQSTEQQQ